MNLADLPLSHAADASAAPAEPTEAQVRHDLAALYRLIAHFKMTDLIDTHISARVPGPEHHFLINRYGVLFHEMRPEDLVKIDTDGNPVDPGDADANRVNAAGFTIHSAIHMARHDLSCVIHTHTADGMAVACRKKGLLPITQHALRFYDRLGYHDYEGIALDLAERERLVADMGTHKAMILRNHGLLAAGRTIPEAFVNIYFLERACQAQVKATMGGDELVYPSAEVCERTARQFERPTAMAYCERVWKAALRLL
ncbi:class II aldolase/adducin family protein [Variovorax arabinosiphilus]|uniref:class II aldolase/adducin family protein n=1 Tax=Variovorax arabinosiphilus TaxID=3053498 RepID=UPI002576F515|nr:MULTISPECIES: class II aldolase/adducin family protein [unclassified Variovorax]MDM0122421.1 class II aldolase/adducin family protein [Variovorax sp. J2L1-78]MDM0131050.1 class II aldolase/adducin family protein [Variovorax sp. J2L1-63]MDM0235184.1 class II aldolase/adducin family protein [Variovorax sp. J2R1-6]